MVSTDLVHSKWEQQMYCLTLTIEHLLHTCKWPGSIYTDIKWAHPKKCAHLPHCVNWTFPVVFHNSVLVTGTNYTIIT